MTRTNARRPALWASMLLTFATAALAANQPPTANLLAPPPETGFGVGDNIEIRAQASDAESGITKVEFYANGSMIGEDFVPPYALWWSNVTAGTYFLQVVAVDDAFARGTSVVNRVTVTSLSPRILNWIPNTVLYNSFEWNGTSVNWSAGGRPTVFHPRDSVSIAFTTPTIFIGTEGVPMPVSPASTVFRSTGVISGGDILTGGVVFDFAARVAFSNYVASLSFPGGTLIQSSPGFTFDVSSALPGATLHFGTGAITNQGTFTLQTGDAGITFENDFVVRNPGTLAVNPIVRPTASVRFSGALYLGADFTMQITSDTVVPRPPHEWSGPIVLQQDSVHSLRFTVPSTAYLKPLIISGSISDGQGDATNVLVFSGYGPFRLTGSNTYAHGTRIETSPYPFGVEVAPESSLGRGNVQVFGNLTLLGNRNIASNANAQVIAGRIYLGRDVKIRLNALTLGGTSYTNGLFAGTNVFYANYLASNGSFRLPPVNLNPTVSITNPLSGASFVAGDSIPIRASAVDVDSYIRQVEFRLNGTIFAVRTNVPFQATLREAPAGVYRMQAIAYDDDGGVGSSSVVTINVQPRIDRIEMPKTNLAVLEFDAPLLSPYAIEAANVLPAWSNLATLPAEGARRRIRFTNAFPDAVRTRFYRLSLP